MLRVFGFLAIILVAGFGLSWLADQQGSLAITFADKVYEVSLLVGAVFLTGLSLVLMLLWSVLRFLLRLPGLVSISNQMRRRSKGFSAVSKGMIALSSGDKRNAELHAMKANQLVESEPLSLLLNAQSAQLSGKSQKAQVFFEKMLETADMRIVGLRGLYVEARRRGDASGAYHYAEEAYKIAPAIAWASQSTLENACSQGNWTNALKIVDQSASRHVFGKAESHRQRAVLFCAKALEEQEPLSDKVQHYALEALKLEPGLVPAAVLAGSSLSAKGNYKRASKIIETAWKHTPHPSLAQTYVDIRRGDSALDRLKRAQNLAKILPENRESRFVVAKSALEAKEFTLARQNLELLVLEKPTVRACLMMAELEEQEFNRAGIVREWLNRAAYAPRDPAWVAEDSVSDTWHPVSPVNGKLDAYQWREPPQSSERHLQIDLGVDTDEAAKFSQLPKPSQLETSKTMNGSLKTDAASIAYEKPQPIIFAVAHAPDDPGSLPNT